MTHPAQYQYLIDQISKLISQIAEINKTVDQNKTSLENKIQALVKTQSTVPAPLPSAVLPSAVLPKEDKINTPIRENNPLGPYPALPSIYLAGPAMKSCVIPTGAKTAFVTMVGGGACGCAFGGGGAGESIHRRMIDLTNKVGTVKMYAGNGGSPTLGRDGDHSYAEFHLYDQSRIAQIQLIQAKGGLSSGEGAVSEFNPMFNGQNGGVSNGGNSYFSLGGRVGKDGEFGSGGGPENASGGRGFVLIEFY